MMIPVQDTKILTNNMPIIFEDDLKVFESNEMWDSEEKYRKLLYEATLLVIVWKTWKYIEDFGSNISDAAETTLDVYLQIFPIELIECFVFQTNLYAFQKTDNSSFVHTNAKDIRTFLGLILLMGIKIT